MTAWYGRYVTSRVAPRSASVIRFPAVPAGTFCRQAGAARSEERRPAAAARSAHSLLLFFPPLCLVPTQQTKLLSTTMGVLDIVPVRLAPPRVACAAETRH